MNHCRMLRSPCERCLGSLVANVLIDRHGPGEGRDRTIPVLHMVEKNSGQQIDQPEPISRRRSRV